MAELLKKVNKNYKTAGLLRLFFINNANDSTKTCLNRKKPHTKRTVMHRR